MTVIDEYASYPTFCNGRDVWVNDLCLNTIDPNGSKWLVSDIDGWWGLPDAVLPQDELAYTQDGDFYTAGRFSAREMTLTGSVVSSVYVAGKPVHLAENRDQFNRMLSTMVRGQGVLRVDEPDAAKIAYVQISGKPLIKFDTLNNVLGYQVDFKANDPRKYSLVEEQKSTFLPEPPPGREYDREFDYEYGGSSPSGMISTPNVGNYGTFGVFTITGPIINPVIEHVETGSRLRFQISLGENDTLEIDLRDKTVILNEFASRRSSLTPNSSWMSLEPGQNTFRFSGVRTASLVEPVLTLTYRSAWMD